MQKYLNKITLADCMDVMAEMPDKYIDLVIVDPPYGLDRFNNGNKTRVGRCGGKDDILIKWDKKPDKKYFDELKRVSKFQIIWGANNFENIGSTEYFIIWNKKQTVDNFASAEYAWTNCKKPAKIFEYSIHQHDKTNKIHPTQKPVALYRWLLQNYAKPGQLIFDSHSGSGSLACACHIEGYNFIATELDPDYHRDSIKRLDELRSQGVLFKPEAVDALPVLP